MEDLRKQFDAILLAGGAEQPRNLNVPGRDLKGIHFAMEFLPQQNRRCEGDTVPEETAILATGKRVVIIGGGDTGADCLGTSHRQGALSVTQFELLPKPPDTRSPSTPWPLWPMQLRVESSHEEGGVRDWSVSNRWKASLESIHSAPGPRLPRLYVLADVDVRRHRRKIWAWTLPTGNSLETSRLRKGHGLTWLTKNHWDAAVGPNQDSSRRPARIASGSLGARRTCNRVLVCPDCRVICDSSNHGPGLPAGGETGRSSVCGPVGRKAIGAPCGTVEAVRSYSRDIVSRGVRREVEEVESGNGERGDHPQVSAGRAVAEPAGTPLFQSSVPSCAMWNQR